MASFASSATTCGARKRAWTKKKKKVGENNGQLRFVRHLWWWSLLTLTFSLSFSLFLRVFYGQRMVMAPWTNPGNWSIPIIVVKSIKLVAKTWKLETGKLSS